MAKSKTPAAATTPGATPPASKPPTDQSPAAEPTTLSEAMQLLQAEATAAGEPISGGVELERRAREAYPDLAP